MKTHIDMLKSTLVMEYDELSRSIASELRLLAHGITNAQRALALGEAINDHLIHNASMLTAQIARWNMVRDLWPYAQNEVDPDVKSIACAMPDESSE